MTLHAVIGEGSINTRELNHQLDDLMQNADNNFWFIVQGKAEPTQADQDLVVYFTEHEIYFVTLTDENVEMATLYEGRADEHVYDGEFGPALVEALESLREPLEDTDEMESVDVLALLVNPKEEDPLDTPAIDAIMAVINAGHQVYGLNDSMEEITLEEEVIEPTDSTPQGDVAGDQSPSNVTPLSRYTEEELSAMPAPEVKALAQGMGITGRGKKDYIAGILGAQTNHVITGSNTAMTTNGANGSITWLPNEQAVVVIHSSKGVQIKHMSLAAAEAL